MDSGGLCVMTFGLPQTRVWLAVNLDFLLPVPAGPQVVLEGEYFLREVELKKSRVTAQLQSLSRLLHKEEWVHVKTVY